MKKENLEWFKYFTNICSDNNIWYSLMCGTLIGAIRHNGPIPWDDDFDIIMKPEGYKKLKKLFPQHCLDGISNKKYPLIAPKFVPNIYDLSKAIFVDIFIVISIGDKMLKKQNSFFSKVRYSLQLYRSNWQPNSLLNKIRKYLTFPIWHILKNKTYKNCIVKIQKSREIKKFHYLITLPIIPKKLSTFSNFSFETIPWQFSNFEVRVIKNYDSILIQAYDDYMMPKKEYTTHTDVISTNL